ncbi:MAG: DUF4160 domain-containing protein [Chloroflexi bacterium]|nr:DUF4160 domain-containing protein [Chloroflexota bacterium]
MVTVLYRQRHGYDVVIHTEDHGPAHVHVIKGGNEVLIELTTWRIIENRRFNERELRRIRRLLRENETLLMETWSRLHDS